MPQSQQHRTVRHVLKAIALIALAVSTTDCRRNSRVKYAPAELPRVLGVEMSALQPAIAARIEREDRPDWVTAERWKRVRALYQRFGNAPLWLQEGGVKDRATALLEEIRSAPEHALDTAGYPLGALQAVVDAKRLTDTASAGTLADADVLLTSAYVAYASDMLVGQVDPKTVSQAWHIPAVASEVDSALVRGIETPDIRPALDSMAPQDPDYAALKAAFARYSKAAASGGWSAFPTARGPEQFAAVHARLVLETAGDSAGAAAPAAKDTSDFAGLLRQFQERHGLERTGTLNPTTLTALNVSAAERAKQIGANLERHRWLPRSLGSRYVYVNVPAFRLDAYDSGQKTLSMKVVVGQEYEGKVTPVFSDSMETVVFRPYWNITPDIQANEVGPKAARDGDYLARNDMEYYKDGGATRIRQRPGPKNSLGLVKFLFPNSFNIYLHDTPAKELFNKTDRAASHGCIRLEKPAEMAQWVLGWDATRVSAAMHSGADNQAVKVPAKIPVYIVYFTAYTRDGQLYFGDDVYGRDDALEKQVAEGVDTSTKR